MIAAPWWSGSPGASASSLPPPWVFASYRTARQLTGFAEHQTTYVIGRFSSGADPARVRDALARILRRTDVFLSEQLAARTRDYWMFTTGAGTSVLTSAVLGLLVGMVIVAQVLYVTTDDHLPEFGTLRAMGAPRAFIYKVIMGQAVISATFDGLPGIALLDRQGQRGQRRRHPGPTARDHRPLRRDPDHVHPGLGRVHP